MATRKAVRTRAATGPGRKMAKSALKRQQILDAAARTFREKGYASTTLNDIAAAAGTQAGSLYYYFASREELVEKVLEISMQNTARHVAEAIDALPPDASNLLRIETGLRAHVSSLLEMDDYVIAYQRIIYQVPEEVRQHFVFFPRAYANVWRGLIDAARLSGELRTDLNPTVMRLLMLGAITWVTEWYKPHGPNTSQEIADHVVDLFFHGIVAAVKRPARPPSPARQRAVRKPRAPRPR